MNNNPIVIVDDDPDDLAYLGDALGKAGIKNKCKCFYSALPALQFLKSAKIRPAIIISDINMPKMNGFTFKKAVEADPALCDVPFVFLSTGCHDIDTSSTRNLATYLAKPDGIDGYLEIALYIQRLSTAIVIK